MDIMEETAILSRVEMHHSELKQATGAEKHYSEVTYTIDKILYDEITAAMRRKTNKADRVTVERSNGVLPQLMAFHHTSNRFGCIKKLLFREAGRTVQTVQGSETLKLFKFRKGTFCNEKES